jgi:hypothetical protein
MAASVHFMMLELLEHAASVQREDMALLAMHVVGIMHAFKDAWSQQPWTPFWGIVAQTRFELEHVTGDSSLVISIVKWYTWELGRT